jgi:hypothetical protein
LRRAPRTYSSVPGRAFRDRGSVLRDGHPGNLILLIDGQNQLVNEDDAWGKPALVTGEIVGQARSFPRHT